MLWKILFVLLIGGIIAAAIGRARAKQQQAAKLSELNQHPERLEQSLDETDDA
jgi:multisubunit Na+/H+ antiporter MnhG subunit